MKIANAPCSWGVLEFGMEGEIAGYETVLDEIRLTGYSGTELGDWGFMPVDPEQLHKELGKRSLQLVGAFVPVNYLSDDDYQAGKVSALKTARLLRDSGHPTAQLVLSDDNGKNETRTRYAGRIQPSHGLNRADRKRFGERVNELAKIVRDETGIGSTFHHHCAGFVETPDEIAALLDLTAPELVSLCFDTGHFAFGGGDPVQGLKTFADRIGHVHFKDWDQSIYRKTVADNLDYFEAVGLGIFCELGKGIIDFEAILRELKSQNYSGWIVVEQDSLPGMGTPKESALRNREFLRRAGL